MTQQHSGFEAIGPITMTDEGLVYIELRPDLDYDSVRAHGAPTGVNRGVIDGFSLPVYAADNEELFLEICAPDRYDEASDILVHVYCYLASGAQPAGKTFKLQLEWEYFTPGTVVPNTVAETLDTGEVDAGGAAQYQSYMLEFTLDYDAHGAGDPLVSKDQIGLRLIRLTTGANEITGEVVITHVGVIFRRNKLGVASP